MRPSLRNNLVIALGALASAVAIAQGISSYQLCSSGMSALLDLRLEQVATRMRNGYADSIPVRPERGSQPSRDIVITIRKPDAEVPFRSTEPSLPLPPDAAAGFTSHEVNGERWRIFTLREPETLIQVAQRSSVRDQLERETAVKTLWPTLALLPLVLALRCSSERSLCAEGLMDQLCGPLAERLERRLRLGKNRLEPGLIIRSCQPYESPMSQSESSSTRQHSKKPKMAGVVYAAYTPNKSVSSNTLNGQGMTHCWPVSSMTRGDGHARTGKVTSEILTWLGGVLHVSDCLAPAAEAFWYAYT